MVTCHDLALYSQMLSVVEVKRCDVFVKISRFTVRQVGIGEVQPIYRQLLKFSKPIDVERLDSSVINPLKVGLQYEVYKSLIAQIPPFLYMEFGKKDSKRGNNVIFAVAATVGQC